MITIFATPKAFKGQFSVIQENAIASWTKLKPKCQIIFLGDEEGVAKISKKYKTLHIPKVALSKWGTPILPDLFEKAYEKAKFPILAYINSDIILTDDFIEAVKRVDFPEFFITGSRIDIEIKEKLNFESMWQIKLKDKAAREGRFIARQGATDYFIFTPKVDFKLPRLIVGRTFWDAYIIYKAKLLKLPIIDATEAIGAIHQTHDYSHAGGWKKVWNGPESEINKKLIGNRRKCFNLWDIDYILTDKGLKHPKMTFSRLMRKIEITPVLMPATTPLLYPLNFFIRACRFVRDQWRLLKSGQLLSDARNE